jgi:hypothetical protein
VALHLLLYCQYMVTMNDNDKIIIIIINKHLLG